MNDICERCGLSFVKKDDDCDVCEVCLVELELDMQYETYVLDCQLKGVIPLSYDVWVEEDEEE